MKIVVGFTSLLIAAILNLVNALPENLQALCERNGAPGAYVAVQAAVIQTQNCYLSIVQDIPMQYQKTENGREAARVMVCSRIEALKNCMKGLVEPMKSCYELEKHASIDISYSIAVSALQFACDNSELIQEAVNSPNIDCLFSKLEYIDGCFKELGETTTDESRSPMTTLSYHFRRNDSPRDKLVEYNLPLSKDQCRVAQRIEECVVELIDQCPDKIFSRILDSLLTYINKNLPCDNLPTSLRSGSSPSSIINLSTILIAVTTMAL